MSNKETDLIRDKPSQKRELRPTRRFPEFLEAGGWRSRPLRELATIIDERAGTRACTPMSITSGVGLVTQEEKFGRTIAGQQYKNYVVLQREDFAYNKSATKEFPQGFIAIYRGNEVAAVPSSIFTCFRVRRNKIDPAYLNYLFVNNVHGKWLRQYITVGARAHGSLNVNDEDLLSLPIPMPDGHLSLAEQQKLADCLSSIDHLIAVEARMLVALKAYTQGLLQQLFPAEGETVPRLRFPEFRRTGEWKVCTLEQVATYENGKAHENDISETGRYIVVNSKFVSTDGEVRKYSDVAFCIADIGDTLMVLSDVPNGRAIGKCYFVDADDLYTVNQRICKIKPTAVNSKFLFYILDRNRFFLAFDDGIKQTNLRKEEVLNCPLCLPPLLEEQRKISDLMSLIGELATAHIKKIDSLKAHKKCLMQQLFPSTCEDGE